MSAYVAVFARAPVAGEAKTRLAEGIGAERAAELAAAFLHDVVRTLADVPGIDVGLHCAGDLDHPAFRALETPRQRQHGADLGERMSAALAHGALRCGRAIVIGSDSPALPAWAISMAIDALDRADVVLGPTADGGYYLVGTRKPERGLFDGVRFSSPHARADTEARARSAGLSLALISPFYDVDTAADLALLRAHLAVAPHHAPATARVLFGAGARP